MKQAFKSLLLITLALGSTNVFGMDSLFEESKQVFYTPDTQRLMPPASAALTPQAMAGLTLSQAAWQNTDIEGQKGESKEAIKLNHHDENDLRFKLLYDLLTTMPRELVNLILDYAKEFEGKHVRTINSKDLLLVSNLITLSPHIIGAYNQCSKVILFDLETGKQLKTINEIYHTPIRLSENELASCSYLNDIIIVNWQTGATKTINIGRNFHGGVAKLPHGPLMTNNHDSKTIKFWNPNTGNCVQKMNVALHDYHDYFDAYDKMYEAIPLSEHIIAIKERSRVILWNIHTGEKTIISTWLPQKLIPLSATTIAIAKQATIEIHDTTIPQLIRTIETQSKFIDVTKFPTENIIVAAIAHEDKMIIELYNPETGTCLKSFETGLEATNYFSRSTLICPYDTCIVALGDGQHSGKREIRIWN